MMARYGTFHGTMTVPKPLVPLVFIFKALRYYGRLCCWPRPWPAKAYMHFRLMTAWGPHPWVFIFTHPIAVTRDLALFIMWT